MEYIDGDSLKASLLARRDRRETYPLGEAVQVVNDIASALDYAHAHGIVHRDVKPANIMLRSEERLAQFAGGSDYSAVLTDFGIARMLEGVQLTNPGATVGTPDYMSPEQARGDPAEAASDVYALAIVLYEMLTGELPFHADTPVAVLVQHMHEDPPRVGDKVSDLPEELDGVIRRAMAKDPVERFPTAGALAIELTRILEYHT
jgi:serine/threonine-protein kinase